MNADPTPSALHADPVDHSLGLPPEAERCNDDVCITCGDVAVPVRVVRLLPGEMAVVDVEGRSEEVSVALVPAEVGAMLLVHAGEAIARLDPEEFPCEGRRHTGPEGFRQARAGGG